MTKDKPYEEPLGGSYVINRSKGTAKRVEFTKDDHLVVKPETASGDQPSPNAALLTPASSENKGE